jgi:hypothetical protein
MDGFKSSPKMQCFKEGGAVKYKSRHSEKSEMSKDIAKDKKVVKKAFAMHDKQEHPGEKTDLSKLKKGGRMKKKDGGCVGRYKAGGSIGMKKDSGDIKDIQKIKLSKTKKAAAPSAAMMAEPTPYKKGGNVKKCAEGGSLKSVDAEENPGLAKLPTNVRNKMGYAKKGGEVKKMNTGGMVTDEERARMPAGKLPQQMTDELAKEENAATRGMITGPVKKFKDMLLRKGDTPTTEQPILKPGTKREYSYKKGGKAC